jgi:hypothetical protein
MPAAAVEGTGLDWIEARVSRCSVFSLSDVGLIWVKQHTTNGQPTRTPEREIIDIDRGPTNKSQATH